MGFELPVLLFGLLVHTGEGSNRCAWCLWDGTKGNLTFIPKFLVCPLVLYETQHY